METVLVVGFVLLAVVVTRLLRRNGKRQKWEMLRSGLAIYKEHQELIVGFGVSIPPGCELVSDKLRTMLDEYGITLHCQDKEDSLRLHKDGIWGDRLDFTLHGQRPDLVLVGKLSVSNGTALYKIKAEGFNPLTRQALLSLASRDYPRRMLLDQGSSRQRNIREKELGQLAELLADYVLECAEKLIRTNSNILDDRKPTTASGA